MNEEGTVALPMRIVAAVFLLAIIISISAASLTDFTHDAQVMRFSGDLTTLDSRASTVYHQGGARDINNPEDYSGTKETTCFVVPDGIEMVVFGSMPPQDMRNHCNTTPDESNFIYYRTDNGVIKTMTSRARYAEGQDMDKAIILTPGSYELTMELVKSTRGMFITLY